MSYGKRVREVLDAGERRIFERLTSPQKIQDFLDTLPINFEVKGETYMSPRRLLRAKTAHCLEGALLGAAALAYHGQKPLLMDFQTSPEDEDHVITLFRQNGLWGAISKTNHAILRYRDPVYKTPRELAMSYFNEYVVEGGKKTMRAFSAPFDLSRYAPKRWVVGEEELQWLVDDLDNSRHFPAVAKKNIKHLRKASGVELRALTHVEWRDPRSKRR